MATMEMTAQDFEETITTNDGSLGFPVVTHKM